LDEATFETRLREALALHPSRSARALTELDVLIDRPIDVDARQSTGPHSPIDLIGEATTLTNQITALS
jgi:hypothetical protein